MLQATMLSHKTNAQGAIILLGTIAIKEGDWLLNPLRERLGRYAWDWPRKACTIAASSLGSEIGNYASLAVARAGLSGQMNL